MTNKKLKLKETDKLRVCWGKEEYERCEPYDLVIRWPMMQNGSADGSWIFSKLFNEENRKELERRGYDITTLKFSIEPKLVNPTRPERFQTLLKKYKGQIKELEQ